MTRPPTDLYRLPAPRPLLAGESLASLITRNAEPYRFRDPMRVVTRAHPSVATLPALATQDWTADFRTRLACLLDIPEEVLEGLRYGSADKMVNRLFGVPVHRDFVTVNRRRVCPLCLQEASYHRMLWDLTILTICPTHGVRLVDRCPREECRRPLKWTGSRVAFCSNIKCRQDLRTVTPQAVDEMYLPIIRCLAGYLQGTKPVDVGPPGLTAADCLRLTLQLGAFSDGVEKVGRPTWMLEQHAHRLHQTLYTGWHALTDWPNGFHRLLDGLRTRSKERRGRFGLRKEFGYLSHWLSRMAAEPWCRPLGTAFADYIAEQVDFASTAAGLRRYGSAEALANRHITTNEAARFLDVSVQTMLALAEREDLFLVRPSGAGAPSLLRADKVRALRERKAAMLLKSEAERFLGVTRDTFTALETAGLITGAAPDTRITQQRQYTPERLNDLVRRLETTIAKGGTARSGLRLFPITDAVHIARPTADVCTALLDGRLRASGIDKAAVGLARILVDKAAVLTALTRARRTLSVVQAAKAMNVAVESARLWISRGFLQASSVGDNPLERGLRVTQAAIVRFQDEYGTAATVAVENGFGSGPWLTHRLAFFGVRAVSGPGIDGGEGALFRRSDLAPELVAKAAAQPKNTPKENRSTKEAFDRAARIGHATAKILDRPLKRGWNDFSDSEAGIYVQVVTGKRATVTGPHSFRLNAAKFKKLQAAQHPWLAFAFPDQDFMLLVPWQEVAPSIRESAVERHAIAVKVDAQGSVDRFGGYKHALDPEAS